MRVVVMLALLLPLCGCSAWKPMKPPLEPAPEGRALPPKVRLLLRDSTEVTLLDGRVVADSLVGRAEIQADSLSASASGRYAVAVTDVLEARTLQHSHEKSALFLLAFATVGILAFLGFMNLFVPDD